MTAAVQPDVEDQTVLIMCVLSEADEFFRKTYSAVCQTVEGFYSGDQAANM